MKSHVGPKEILGLLAIGLRLWSEVTKMCLVSQASLAYIYFRGAVAINILSLVAPHNRW